MSEHLLCFCCSSLTGLDAFSSEKKISHEHIEQENRKYYLHMRLYIRLKLSEHPRASYEVFDKFQSDKTRWPYYLCCCQSPNHGQQWT